MYFVAILAALISYIAPSWGLFLIVGFGNKYHLPKQNRVFWGVNVSVLVALMLLAKGEVSTLNFFDAFVGSTVYAFLFFWALNSSESYTKAIFVTFITGLLYSIFRNFFFSPEISKSIQDAYALYVSMLQKGFAENQDKFMAIKDFVWRTKNLLQNYQIAIWNISEMFFFYLAILLMLKKNNNFEIHKKFRLPYISVYLLIIFLVLSLVPNLKHLGYNLTLSLATLFIIQGFSILDYFWGEIFSRSKFLMFLLIASLLFNTFVLILVAFMGLLDIWIDLRKLKNDI